jgi:hypothetical protein
MKAEKTYQKHRMSEGHLSRKNDFLIIPGKRQLH